MDSVQPTRRCCQFLPDDLGGVPHWWDSTLEVHQLTSATGTLYLGVFNGPTEGILLIVGIYFITAIYGMKAQPAENLLNSGHRDDRLG
jgi:hypothetical protein